MKLESNPTEVASAGLSGSLRVVASLCIVALAVAGVLVVFEVIPRSAFAEVGGKVLAVGGIVLAASVALGLLSRR
jgi:hypothetical protein